MLTGLLDHAHLLRLVLGMRHSYAARHAWRCVCEYAPLATRSIPALSGTDQSPEHHTVVLLGDRAHSAMIRHFQQLLALFGYTVQITFSIADTLAFVGKSPPSLIAILDPFGSNLLDAMQALRAGVAGAAEFPPVIVLGPADDPRREVAELANGADEFLPCTVGGELLHARLRMLQRRGYYRHAPLHCAATPVTFDHIGHRVWIHGHKLDLPPRLFRLLAVFVYNPEQVLSTARLLSLAWNDAPEAGPATVKSHVYQLRRILAAHGLHRAIVTINRIGYRYEPPAAVTSRNH